MDAYNLKNKTAIVTGGGSGMGRATALLFAQHGARVVVADINLEGAEATVAQIEKEGGAGIAIRTDVSVSSDVRNMIETAVRQFGSLDCAANAAGLAVQEGGMLGCSEETWERMIRVNLTGTFLCVKYQAEKMLEKGGAIVNFSSIGGLIGSAAQPGYVAAKHGVLGITKSAGIELGERKVRVNAVCPGFIRTPMTEGLYGDKAEELGRQSNPMKRAGQPMELASAAVWLCSDAASYVNGSTIVIDGGWLSGVPA